VLAALEDGPAYPDELAETTGLTRGTIKNAITTLKKAGRVEVTGEMQGQMEQVQLVAPAARPIKGSATSAASTPTPEQRVAEMLRNPPGWLGKQLEKLRNDPDRYMRATAAAIADEVYGTTEDADKVRQNLEAYVAEPDLDQA
jgi:DNA-binding transcriptional ArsR family regulator